MSDLSAVIKPRTTNLRGSNRVRKKYNGKPDLADRSARKALRCRCYPYYESISVGRHLGYQKRPGAVPVWIARISLVGGGWKQRVLGAADDHSEDAEALSYEQAQREAEEWIKRTTPIVQAIPTRPLGAQRWLKYSPVGSVYTVCHALYDYLEMKRLYGSPKHVEIMITLMNRHVLDRIGTLSLEHVDGTIVRRFIRDVLETPPRQPIAASNKYALDELDDERLRLQRRTANTMISILRQAFLLAWEDKKTENERSWRLFKRIPNVSRPRCVHLARDEAQRLVAATEGALKQLLLGALYSGCRVGELLAMQVCDVGRDGYGVYVKPGKRKQPRFVFLADEGMAFFLSCVEGRDQDEMLFEKSPGVPWSRYCYGEGLRRAAIRANLSPGLNWHALRHTYASQLIQSGASFKAVADQLGHRDPTTVLRTYAHLSPQVREAEVRQRFTRLDEEFAGLADTNQSIMEQWRSRLHGEARGPYAQLA